LTAYPELRFAKNTTPRPHFGKCSTQLETLKKTIEYDLAKHYDTQYLTYAQAKPGLVILTEKLHGTSGRTGKVQYTKLHQTLLDKIKAFFKPSSKYTVVTGTRNTICVPGWAEQSAEEKYRVEIHNLLAPLLRDGETFFYEIVGFTSTGSPIMPPHSLDNVKDKVFRKYFPNPIIYKYGEAAYTFYVYRITQELGDSILELTWDQVLNRCEQLGIKAVPEITSFYYDTDIEGSLINFVKLFLVNQHSTLDSEVLMEGLCIRIENRSPKIYKAKNFMFGVLEGWAKENDTYVDTEEIN
jgi:hypothetical protein